MRWRRVLAYAWAAPTSMLGLLLLPLVLASGGRVRVVAGVLEIHGRAAAWLLRHATLVKGGALALTLGHVVLGRDAGALDASREHERVHVRQCERWGPLFVPAYSMGSVWAWLRGGDLYKDNPFERAAFEQSPRCRR